MGGHTVVPDQVTDSRGQHPGLPGSGSCEDQERPLEVGYRFLLLRIQALKVRNVRGDAGTDFNHSIPSCPWRRG
jgi:hypothetical protein